MAGLCCLAVRKPQDQSDCTGGNNSWSALAGGRGVGLRVGPFEETDFVWSPHERREKISQKFMKIKCHFAQGWIASQKTV